MNSKIILSVMSIALVLILSTLVSGLTFNTPQEIRLSNNQTIATLTSVDNVDVSSLTLNPVTITEGSSSVTFSILSSQSFAVNSSNPQEVKLGILNVVNPVAFKSYNSILTAFGVNSTGDNVNASTTLTFQKGFCKQGPAGANLTIDRVDISNTGDEDSEWEPLDQITVEVRIQNENDDVDIKEVYVELGLFDGNGKNKVGGLDFSNSDDEKISLGTINDGDDKTATFEFTVPADFNFDDGSSYKLAIKAYSDKTGESSECVDSTSELDNTLYESISIDRQNEEGMYIAFDDILFQEEATCSDVLTLDATVFNVGDSDQDELSVQLINKALGINLRREIRNGLDMGDDVDVSFEFVVPANAKDGNYNLELYADYEDGSSDDPASVPLKILGCSSVPTTSGIVNIVADASDAKAGETSEVIVRVSNLGNQEKTFVIGASGYESWASLQPITDRFLELGAGETQEVIIRLDVDKSASGDKSFVVEVTSGDEVETETVTVSVEKGSAFNLNSLQGNGLIWLIGLINIVLIVVIIIVAVRVAKR